MMLSLAIAPAGSVKSFAAFASEDPVDACVSILSSVPKILQRHTGRWVCHLRLTVLGVATPRDWEFVLDAGQSREDCITALLPELQKAAPMAIWQAESLLDALEARPRRVLAG